MWKKILAAVVEYAPLVVQAWLAKKANPKASPEKEAPRG